MKSYFKFLSRNKFYTAINVLGLSVSLMFVIIIGTYVMRETRMDVQHSKGANIYAASNSVDDGDGFFGWPWRLQFRLRDRFPAIENSCSMSTTYSNIITGPDGKDVKADVMLVDSTFYSMFDFGLISGDRSSVLRDKHSAVVTENFARTLFGDEDPIGRSFKIRNDSTIVFVTGIMEPIKNSAIGAGIDKPIDVLARCELLEWINPYSVIEGMNNAGAVTTFLQITPGTDIKALAQDATDYARGFFWVLQDYPENHFSFRSLRDLYFSDQDMACEFIGTGDPAMIRILIVAGILILFFAIINYVNLTVAQATNRTKEMAMRRLLGDNRTGIIRRLISESLVITGVSAIIGAALAVAALPFASELLAVHLELSELLTPGALLPAFVLLVLTAIAAGIIPAVIISTAKPMDVVRGTFRRVTKQIFSKIFIVFQNVVTIVMLTCTFTMFLQLRHLINAPMGFDYSNVILLPGMGNLSAPMKERIRQIAGVEDVVLTRGTPYDGGNNNTFRCNDNVISLQYFEVEKGWRDVFRIEVESDNGNTNGYFVTRRLLAEEGLPDNADSFYYGQEAFPIRGIVKDFKIRGILAEQRPMAILEEEDLQYPWAIAVRTHDDPLRVFDAICDVYKELAGEDYDLRDYISTPLMEDLYHRQFLREERILKLMVIFAAIALIISILGLIAMSTYYVEQRACEIAVRKVNGATGSHILMRLMRSFLSLVGIAVLIAIPIAYLLMGSWLSGYVYRISLHWWIFALGAASCLLASALAVIVQSARAAAANPITYLRQ